MICPFGALSLHLNFPAVSLYISNFAIVDKTITFAYGIGVFFIKVVFDMLVFMVLMLGDVWFWSLDGYISVACTVVVKWYVTFGLSLDIFRKLKYHL